MRFANLYFENDFDVCAFGRLNLGAFWSNRLFDNSFGCYKSCRSMGKCRKNRVVRTIERTKNKPRAKHRFDWSICNWVSAFLFFSCEHFWLFCWVHPGCCGILQCGFFCHFVNLFETTRYEFSIRKSAWDIQFSDYSY